MTHEQPFIIGGHPGTSATPLDVTSPYDGTRVGRTWLAGHEELEAAAAAAVGAEQAMRELPAWRRGEILATVSQALKARRDEFGRRLAGEAGKPIRDALVEVDRASMTFQVAAEEARRIFGEVIPLDLAPHGTRRFALTRRFPLGAVAGISPFNFPLNLVAHKLAPAVAAGNPIVLKPASKTPLSAIALGQLLVEAGLPTGGVSILPMDRATGDRLVTDTRFKLLTFTGSSAVGWAMKARAGKKRVILELGGNAGVVIDDTADVELAVARVVAGGFAYAGQSCISVQRVFLHERVFDRFASALVDRLAQLKVGDPLDPATDLGPMIEPGEVARIDAWVREAVAGGGRILAGGTALSEAVYAPTVLADVPERERVCADEVFAPLVVLTRFADFSEALAAVNRSAFGLQAGVFTQDLERALRAFETLEVGGVMVNDVPTFRVDHMPYGGVKDSGLGREGPRYTIEEMTEMKLLVINRLT